jgi:thiol-disulfide isomerase/thioredoxin
MRLLTLSLSILCIASASAAHAADPPASLPASPIVERFMQTVANAKTLTVQVSADDGAGKSGDSATLTLSRPDRVKVVAGKSTMVSDGKTLQQSDGKSLYSGKAPASLEDLEPPMDGGRAADLAIEAFLTPDQFAVLPEFVDQGESLIEGHTAHRLTVTTARGTKTLWLDELTGLPIRYFYQRPKGSFTVTFGPYQIDRKVSASTFAVRPSSHLATFTPPADPDLLAPGTVAPDFSLSDVNGNPVHLSDYKGKVVMMDFWASWCVPCKMAMPHVQKVYSDLQSKGLTVLSVNTWDQKPFMEKFVTTHPWFTTTMLYDPNPGAQSLASSEYKVTGIPTLYIIGPDGKIAAGFVGFEPGDEEKVRAALAKLGVQ